MAIVFRHDDLADGIRFADTLRLVVEVIIVFVDIFTVLIELVGHGDDAIDTGNLEVIDGSADDVERRG